MKVDKKSNSKKKTKPWQDEFGRPLPDSELKEVSRNWSLEDWKEFQKRGMGICKSAGDCLGDAKEIEENFSEEDNIWDLCSNGETSASLRPMIPALKRHLQKLAGQEYKVLKHYFVDGMTDRDIARLMDERWETVKARRKRAVKKLQRFFAEEEEAKKNSGGLAS